MEKQQNTKLRDEGKLAYMIAWRDRKIATLQDMLEADRQKDAIYAAYIVYLLSRCAQTNEGQTCLTVSKQDIRALCGAYEIEAKDSGDDFIIILKEKGDLDGAGCGKMADA